MKLRNKKTGKVYTACRIFFGEPLDNLEKTNWKTLKEFCEDWEDYTPQKPLIKDEKIRKAVRVWYDLNTNKDFAVFCEDACTLSIAHSARIEFLERVFDNIKRDYGYPITELCGEEE